MRVYPTHPNSLNISHPIDGKLEAEGSEWTKDGFTARCLMDGAISLDPARSSTAREVSTRPAAVETAQRPVTTRKR